MVHLCTTLTAAEMLEPFGEVGTNYENAAHQFLSQTHFADMNNNKKLSLMIKFLMRMR